MAMRREERPARPLARAPLPPPQLLLVIGALSQYAGAGVAVVLFHSVAPASLAWLRSLLAAVVLCALRRPWQARWTRRRLAGAAVFGVTIALVNVAFYLAIARLALGTAVAIEFVGPVAVAAVGSRRRRDIAGLALLIAGVCAAERRAPRGQRGRVSAGRSRRGSAGAATSSSAIGSRKNAELRPQDGLAAGLAIGAVVLAPVFAWHAGPAFTGAGVFARALARRGRLDRRALRLEQLAMARLTRPRFAVMLALLPATATLMGLVVLGQLPSGADAFGIALVIGAITLTA